MKDPRQNLLQGLIGGLILLACFGAAMIFALVWHDQTPGAKYIDFGDVVTLVLFFLLPGLVGLSGVMISLWSPYNGGLIQVIVGFPGTFIFVLVSFITLISVPLFLVVPIPALAGFFLLARSGSKLILQLPAQRAAQ
jgi:hypothetical protein